MSNRGIWKSRVVASKRLYSLLGHYMSGLESKISVFGCNCEETNRWSARRIIMVETQLIGNGEEIHSVGNIK
jgi:hypothetical protein